MNPRGDGPFQVIERINDNAYKIDLTSKYSVSIAFNVANLSIYDAGGDSRLNPFEERGMMRTKSLSLIRLKNIQIKAIEMTLYIFQLDQSQRQGSES